MLYFPGTRIVRSIEYPVIAGATVTHEGAPLSWSAAGNGVQPCSGTSTDRFAGISFNQQYTPTTLPWVDTLTVPALTPYTATLTYVPIGASAALQAQNMFVYDVTGGNVLTYNAAPTGNQYSIAVGTGVITVPSTLAAHSITVTYQYAPTVIQALYAQGNQPAGTPIAGFLGSTGVILEGVVYTTQFDASVNWSTVATSGILTGYNANQGAVFTTSSGNSGTGGNAVSGYVQSVPTSTQPFLGIYFSL
jgi:hypothetical protein